MRQKQKQRQKSKRLVRGNESAEVITILPQHCPLLPCVVLACSSLLGVRRHEGLWGQDGGRGAALLGQWVAVLEDLFLSRLEQNEVKAARPEKGRGRGELVASTGLKEHGGAVTALSKQPPFLFCVSTQKEATTPPRNFLRRTPFASSVTAHPEAPCPPRTVQCQASLAYSFLLFVMAMFTSIPPMPPGTVNCPSPVPLIYISPRAATTL